LAAWPAVRRAGGRPASIYPVLLLAYVVPRFAHVYADIGGDLPLLSQWLLAAGTAQSRLCR